VSFSAYINSLRIEEFIQRVHSKESTNYQDIFYDVGFRSRATALRNFKQYTGKTPSEYFSN
jgi:YesN/AraC family two-component response regulator